MIDEVLGTTVANTVWTYELVEGFLLTRYRILLLRVSIKIVVTQQKAIKHNSFQKG